MRHVLERVSVLVVVTTVAWGGAAPTVSATSAASASVVRPATNATSSAAATRPAVPEPCRSNAARSVGTGTEEVCPYLVEVASGTLTRTVTRGLPTAAITHTYRAALHGFAAWLTSDQAATLRRDHDVASVTRDMVVTAADTEPNAPWGLDRIDSRSLPLSSTYEYVPNGGAGVRAYVLDTGIRATHHDFGGRVKTGVNFVPDDNGTNDCHGHGTHVAGTIGGATYGVAKAVTLVPVRVLDCTASGAVSGIIAALDWVIADHASGQPAVVNMSLIGGFDAVFNTVVANTVADGVVVVVAAGNGSSDACAGSPASAPDALTVGATDLSDHRASFSNYGSCLDLFAPGVGILSAGISSDTASAYGSGTSMASPHVAGIAAVVYGLHPTMDASSVSAAIVGDATPGVVSDPGPGSPNLLAHIEAPAAPPTAILTAPTSPTNAATLSYAVAFSEPVTGLVAGDFHLAGTASGCRVGAPTGSAASYAVAVDGCSDGTVVLKLGANTVISGATSQSGPAADVATASVTIDRTPPTVGSLLGVPRSESTLADPGIPLRLTWRASDHGGTGIARHEVAVSVNGSVTWTTISDTLTAPAVDVIVPVSGTVRFRARSVDRMDNVSPWAYGPTLSPRLIQQTSPSVRYTGTWTNSTSTAYSGGTARYATTAHASASYTLSGRSIALVTTKAPSRGKTKIYIDGAYVATVDLYATSRTSQVIVWQKSWSTAARRTVKFVVVGTSGRPRVDLDALAVLR